MTTLAAALTNSATEMRVNAADADPAEFYTIDSEVIRVLANSTTVQDGLSPERSVDTTLWQIQRGHGPTTPASHLSGATLTPFPGAGGGGGEVTVEVPPDDPVAVTNIVIPNAVVVGEEATLPSKDFYAQDTDPGAVGTGSVWKDTSAPPYLWWERNAANDGWDAETVVTSSATGAAGAYASMFAESVDGEADSRSAALATGDGAATAKNTAVAGGAGVAESGPSAQSVDGEANVNGVATASGLGNALAGSFATATTGEASASVAAFRGAGEASLVVRVTAAGLVQHIMVGLPTADPTVAGQLWNDTGTLKVSAG